MNIFPMCVTFVSAALVTGTVPIGYEIPNGQEIGHAFYCPQLAPNEITLDTNKNAIDYLRHPAR